MKRLLALAFLAGRAWAGDAFSDGKEAAEKGLHKQALEKYQEAYDDPAQAGSRSSIALWAARCAAAARACPQYHKWRKRTDLLPRSERKQLDERCTVTAPPLLPPPESPPAVNGGCPEGTVVAEDPRHCCPPNTTLRADKKWCDPVEGTLVVDSNLSGALLTGLPEGSRVMLERTLTVPNKGVHLPNGEVKLRVPVGTYPIELRFPSSYGFSPLYRQVQIQRDGERRERFDWEREWDGGRKSWLELSQGTKAPSRSVDKTNAALFIVVGLISTAAGATLYGTCGADVNGSCSETYQKGLSYTAATLMSLFGVAFTIGGGAGLVPRDRPKPFTGGDGKAL